MSGNQEREALERSRIAVEALAFGDAFGETFFADPERAKSGARELPEGPWRYTDDTVMALGIHEMFAECGETDLDRLAEIFAERFRREPWRGYGPNAREVLQGIARGRDWRELSTASFGGDGSYGNGAAMRVPPVGAYFADDLDAVVEAADRTARITHAHPEGRAGAVAVAVAAAVVYRTASEEAGESRDAVFREVLDRVPAGETRRRLGKVAEFGDVGVAEAADRVGSGQRVTAMDTVPFVVWCAARWCTDLEEALWRTASGLGDRDTTCAMVGGIVSQRTGTECPGEEWRRRREELDWRLDSEEHP